MRNDSSWSRKVCPYVVPVAALSNPDNPVSKPIIPAMRAAPRPLKLEFEVAEAQRIRPSFAAIASLAVAKKLASIGAQEYAQAGGLIGYGVDLLGLYRRTAYFIDKILKDAKPADLPIEQPTQFELVINLNTAKTLGLQIAPAMLARAAEIIE
jgi:putative tryptophan/tyrosine transport system substrate-binding protein